MKGACNFSTLDTPLSVHLKTPLDEGEASVWEHELEPNTESENLTKTDCETTAMASRTSHSLRVRRGWLSVINAEGLMAQREKERQRVKL